MNALVPNITPHSKPLGMIESVRAAQRNVLEVIPAICYVQPMITGRMGSRWHMVQDPAANKRIFLDNVENYPKSEVMIRMVRPAVGDSLFTAEGAEWRWQRRTVAPVFAQRNVNALAPFMTETAERAANRLKRGSKHEMVGEMLSATFDVICDVALSGRITSMPMTTAPRSCAISKLRAKRRSWTFFRCLTGCRARVPCWDGAR